MPRRSRTSIIVLFTTPQMAYHNENAWCCQLQCCHCYAVFCLLQRTLKCVNIYINMCCSSLVNKIINPRQHDPTVQVSDPREEMFSLDQQSALEIMSRAGSKNKGWKTKKILKISIELYQSTSLLNLSHTYSQVQLGLKVQVYKLN